MEESIRMNRTELITMSPLVLAYLGDTVFESHIREYLITKNINKKVNDLHKTAIKYVNAKAQATIIHGIEDELTEDETDQLLKSIQKVCNLHIVCLACTDENTEEYFNCFYFKPVFCSF